MKQMIISINPDVHDYYKQKPTKETKDLLELYMRRPLIMFMARLRLSSRKYIRKPEAGKSWFDKAPLKEGGKPRPLAPYTNLYKVSPPDSNELTSRTGALLAGISEGNVSDWMNVSATRKKWETGSSYKTLKGTINGYVTDGGVNATWSTRRTLDSGSEALKTYKDAYHHWNWKTPGEKNGGEQRDITNVLHHFRHESRGAGGSGHRRPYFLRAAAEELIRLQTDLDLAFADFARKWSRL